MNTINHTDASNAIIALYRSSASKKNQSAFGAGQMLISLFELDEYSDFDGHGINPYILKLMDEPDRQNALKIIEYLSCSDALKFSELLTAGKIKISIDSVMDNMPSIEQQFFC